MKRLLVLAATLLPLLSAPALAAATNAPAADTRQRGGSGDQFYRVFLGQNDANGDGVITKSEFRGSAAHFDAGYKLNQWAWVTNCWEISLVPQVKNLPVLTRWLEGIRTRWPNAECLTQGDFGSLWRRHHPDNAHLDYRFVQRGTGMGRSDANLEIRWFMNHQFRLALLRDSERSSPETVIDFTRCDRPAREPQDLGRNWSLLGRINQKQTRPQDQPCALTALPDDDRALIRSVIPNLGA